MRRVRERNPPIKTGAKAGVVDRAPESMSSKRTKELLADRLRDRLSHNAYENLKEDGVWMDSTEMGQEINLKGHLATWPAEQAAYLLDFEETVGGARRTPSAVYGVNWRPGTREL